MNSTPMPDGENQHYGTPPSPYGGGHQSGAYPTGSGAQQPNGGPQWQYPGAPQNGYSPYGPGDPNMKPVNPYQIQPPASGNESCLGCGSIGCFVGLIFAGIAVAVVVTVYVLLAFDGS